MRVLDLFSGIGGFSLGLERAGMQTVAFCEPARHCRRVLMKRFPGVPIYEHIEALGAARLGADGAAPVDLLCGGFPCQDISLAGSGAGLIGGVRSSLWFHFARLIGECRPRWVLIENVAELRRRGLKHLLGHLSALGFAAQWHCIPAAACGAPHIRDRIWIIAYPDREPLRENKQRNASRWDGIPHGRRDVALYDGLARALADAASLQHAQLEPARDSPARYPGAPRDGASQDSRDRAPTLADTHGGRWEGIRVEEDTALQSARGPLTHRCDPGGRRGGALCDPDRARFQTSSEPARLARRLKRGPVEYPDWWAIEPDVGRVAHGIPARVDRLTALGNAVVPVIPEIIGRAIMALEARGW